MLVSLEVENWRSFKTRERFDLSASRERLGSDTLARLPAMYGTRKILPMAAIYGANASGKTNLIEALGFMKHLIVRGTAVDRPIPTEPYLLSRACKKSPTTFEVEILVDNRIYNYGFSVTRERIVEEHLLLQRTRSLELIFRRDSTEWAFGEPYDTDRNAFIAEGTRDNQLFLHNAISQNAGVFRPVYDWFDKRLEIVGIRAQYGAYYMMMLRDDFNDFINERLRRYGTGAAHLSLRTIPQESLSLPTEIAEDILSSIPREDIQFAQLQTNGPEGSEIYVVDLRGDEPIFQKVQLAHASLDGDEVSFDLSQESMGTRRLVKLLPLFFELASNEEEGKVFVVDELDRSFHTELTSDLIRLFLEGCSDETRKQLIFTTHDLLLMTHDSMRRDEQWVAENLDNHGTKLICMGPHGGVRSDKSLLTAYRNGAFGEYPKFS